MMKAVKLGAVGAVSALTFFHVGQGLRGDDAGGEYAYSAHMEGCLRQVRQIVPEERKAVGACECMYGEFEKHGYSLIDAFGSDFDHMSRITRTCAARNGARLPN
ncbi:hypothetical protein [Erythrobacter sp. HKB08]|uniref:hypothetical protein n=1 Tax=Erythrobacter sp. HKB08 TaxID=2502843 RepID=UPI0010091D66|nr:hypothetical protein [Erythrobacter sp. HKB08]